MGWLKRQGLKSISEHEYGVIKVSIICIRCIFEIPTRAIAIRSLGKPHGPASHGGFEEASESDSWLIYRLKLPCMGVLFAFSGV